MSESLRENKAYNNPIIPLLIAISIIIGIVIGIFFASRFAGNRLNVINSSSNKLTELLDIIDYRYVDTINVQEIVDDAIPLILKDLDPHSSYITAKDAKTANDDLNGSFSGIGVMFMIKNDTVYISNIIKDGPSERVGVLAGDRIIAIDGKPYVGSDVTNEETIHRLKGPKGTKVRLKVLRRGETKEFIIERGDIKVQSVEESKAPDLGGVRQMHFLQADAVHEVDGRYLLRLSEGHALKCREGHEIRAGVDVSRMRHDYGLEDLVADAHAEGAVVFRTVEVDIVVIRLAVKVIGQRSGHRGSGAVCLKTLERSHLQEMAEETAVTGQLSDAGGQLDRSHMIL